jgi:acyl-CoA dehydrogenase
MMDFSLSNEHALLIETARKVGEKFGLDYWRDRDAKKLFAEEFWQEVCDSGLASVALPEEFGGSGLGMLEMALVIEALAAAGGGSTVGQLFMNNPIFGGVSLFKFGTDRQKQEMLGPLVGGRLRFAMALTEPDVGSNTLALKTFARRVDGGWRINGSKIWITCMPQAQKVLIVARTTRMEDAPRRTYGFTMFLVDCEREGLTHSAIEKVGTNTNPSSNVYFEEVFARDDEVLGTVDGGWMELLEVLNTERIVTTAGMVGAGKLALRLGVDYAKDRKVFGATPIGAYQGLQFPLAQAHAELECARLMNLKAAWLHDGGKPYGSEANTAKFLAVRAGTLAIERAMQTMGGMGFAKDMHIERLWRDARLFQFAPVSEEMILNFIAVHDLGLPRGY